MVESALGALGELLLLASTFLMRRLGQDAVPVLQRLLSKGPAQRNVLAPGEKRNKGAPHAAWSAGVVV